MAAAHALDRAARGVGELPGWWLADPAQVTGNSSWRRRTGDQVHASPAHWQAVPGAAKTSRVIAFCCETPFTV